MFEVIQKVMEITAAFKAGDYMTVVRLVGELLVMIGQPKQMIAAGETAHSPVADLGRAVAELEACCDDAGKPVGLKAFDAAEPAAADAIDPATVLAIIRAALAVLDWWRKRG